MRLCASQWLLLAVVIVLGLSSLLSGCGKKGPLYLPDQPPAKSATSARQ
ncbi:MAG: lipoprotein [Thioalkalispiraceae bacterium]|jgi:predicted small lipoprotein YifL